VRSQFISQRAVIDYAVLTCRAEVDAMNKDPTRFVMSAGRAMLVLGIVQIGLALMIGTVIAGEVASAPIPKGRDFVVWLFVLLVTLSFLATGIALVVCGVKIKQGRRWAAITGLVISVVFCLLYLMIFVNSGFQIYAFKQAGPGSIVALTIFGVLMLAFASTFSYCRRSFAGLKLMGGYRGRGFEVQVVQRHVAQPLVAQPEGAQTAQPPDIPPRNDD